MPEKKISRKWRRILRQAQLLPISHTAGYYRRVADHAPDFLVRTILRLAAARLP